MMDPELSSSSSSKNTVLDHHSTRTHSMIFIVASSVLLGSLVATSLLVFRGVSSFVDPSRSTSRTGAMLRVAGNDGDATLSTIKFTPTDHLNEFEGYTWPLLKQALCPNGIPNLVLSRSLFEGARFEIYGDDDALIRKEGPPSKTLTKFYVGDYGTSIYMDNDNPRLTTLYLKIWKCGNNQVTGMQLKLWKNTNGTYINHVSMAHALSEEPLFRNRKYTREGKLCIFTVIRDPISHFLSGYNEVEFRMINGVEYVQSYDKNGVPYLAPYTQISYTESAESRMERFSQFVKDVLSEDIVFMTNYVYTHFMPMSRILPVLNYYNQSLTGYLPSLTNLTQTWPVFMTQTCPEMPPLEKIPDMKVMGQHESSQDELGLYRASKDVWEAKGPIARALCIMHAFDYACWDDLPDGIPEFCKEVYQSSAFLQRIKRKTPSLW
jgi:hypothetical protein